MSCVIGKKFVHGLKNLLKKQKSKKKYVKVGVFGFGSVKVDNTDSAAVLKDVALLPSNSQLTFNAAIKLVSGDNVDANFQNFVTNLLKQNYWVQHHYFFVLLQFFLSCP
jgi:hypothetical protein